MLTKRFNHIAAITAMFCLLAVGVAWADKGDKSNGEKVYMKKCWWCHGKKGEADGPGADFMMPPPRDFSMGVYKYKTSIPSADVVRDQDIFDMISNGMPGTSMPAWKEVLTDQERWDLVAYIKSLSDMFDGSEDPKELDYGKKIKVGDEESIKKGKEVFQTAKCFECHGQNGRGDTMKMLKEDSGKFVWPRDLTKPWTFRAGSAPENIFARVSNGIPNTPMPAFAGDTTGNGKLSEEDRWHVVNYVLAMTDESQKVIDGKTVIIGQEVESVPQSENDKRWDDIDGTAFNLVPQIIQKERFFTPSNDTISVKALFDAKNVAIRIEWDDRTKSVMGDARAEAISVGGMTSDAFAVQLPVTIPERSEKPYFGHGDSMHPVSMMYWSSGSTGKENISAMFTAKGAGARESVDAGAAGMTITASYTSGRWRTMFVRKLKPASPDKFPDLEIGKYIPIAFANWDGSNGESGPKHTMTTWYWLLLRPQTGMTVVLYPLAVLILLVVAQVAFAGYLRSNRRKE